MQFNDLNRMYRRQQGGRLERLLACWLAPGFQAVKIYRFGHWLLRQPMAVRLFLRPVEMFLAHRSRKKWGIYISRYATIGPGLVIFHYGGIFVGDATIGRNCNLRHDNTIGAAGNGNRRGVPTIGDNVDIAPGAVIAGKIKIGNNVRIGANAVVQRDVPDNALVQVRGAQVVTFPTLYGSSGETAEGASMD